MRQYTAFFYGGHSSAVSQKTPPPAGGRVQQKALFRGRPARATATSSGAELRNLSCAHRPLRAFKIIILIRNARSRLSSSLASAVARKVRMVLAAFSVARYGPRAMGAVIGMVWDASGFPGTERTLICDSQCTSLYT